MASTRAPKVTVVVLNWNGWPDTVPCVASCLRSDYSGLRILIVDNGSNDGSERILRERFPGIDVLQTGENLGYAGGNNTGLRCALETGADLVVLLNNDTEVDPGFVSALVEASRLRPDAGMLCSKILFHDRPDVLWYAGASFHPWIGWGRHRGHGERDVGQFDRLEETDRPTGCALMVTRTCCQKVGLLREEYFCYAEDLEWGLRAVDAGFSLFYVPASRVWHKVSRSSGGPRSVSAVRYHTRNLLACMDARRPVPRPLRPLRWAAVIGAAAIGLATQGLPVGDGLRAIYRGVADWRTGRFGRIPVD